MSGFVSTRTLPSVKSIIEAALEKHQESGGADFNWNTFSGAELSLDQHGACTIKFSNDGAIRRVLRHTGGDVIFSHHCHGGTFATTVQAAMDQGVDIRNANFARSDLSGFSFRGINFKYADFSDAILTGADFTNTYFDQVSFAGAKLRGAIFMDSSAYDSNFGGADFTDAIIGDRFMSVIQGNEDLGYDCTFAGAIGIPLISIKE